MCHIMNMHSMNIRELRDTKRLKTWLRAGKTVELRERDRVIARIVPEKQEGPPVEYPDFAARRKKIFGDRILPAVDLLIKEGDAIDGLRGQQFFRFDLSRGPALEGR
jgi:antitoxin (DNA-binding transcriptional repressor) of toxin-antitoxin stability system